MIPKTSGGLESPVSISVVLELTRLSLLTDVAYSQIEKIFK